MTAFFRAVACAVLAKPTAVKMGRIMASIVALEARLRALRINNNFTTTRQMAARYVRQLLPHRFTTIPAYGSGR